MMVGSVEEGVGCAVVVVVVVPVLVGCVTGLVMRREVRLRRRCCALTSITPREIANNATSNKIIRLLNRIRIALTSNLNPFHTENRDAA
jgi:hypothetical protein